MADFTTLAKVKVALDISGTGDTANITALIPQVTALIEDMTDRRGVFFQNGEDVIEYPSPRCAGPLLFLNRYPNAAVTTIHLSLTLPRVYDATTLLTADEDYIVETERGVVHSTGTDWPTDVYAIKVVYDGGYVADAHPEVLTRAAEMIIAAMLQKGKDRSYHITGHEIGDSEVRGIRFDDVPDTARNIIELYKNTRLEY